MYDAPRAGVTGGAVFLLSTDTISFVPEQTSAMTVVASGSPEGI
jgi:hypothetical protein